MKQTISHQSDSGWAAWFVLLLGLFLVVSVILTAATALTPTTIWHVLIPGTAIGLLLAVTGALGVSVGMIVGAASGMAAWIAGRRLSNREIMK